MLKSFIYLVDSLNEVIGRLTAGLVLLLVLIIIFEVSNRYLFNVSSNTLQELQWHLFSLIFLLGAADTLKYDAHVRVDIIYHRLSERSQAWINLIGILFLLIPFCGLVVESSWWFVSEAYRDQEISPDGGLPYRFLLKAAIPIGFSLLILQGLANALKHFRHLIGEPPQ